MEYKYQDSQISFIYTIIVVPLDVERGGHYKSNRKHNAGTDLAGTDMIRYDI